MFSIGCIVQNTQTEENIRNDIEKDGEYYVDEVT